MASQTYLAKGGIQSLRPEARWECHFPRKCCHRRRSSCQSLTAQWMRVPPVYKSRRWVSAHETLSSNNADRLANQTSTKAKDNNLKDISNRRGNSTRLPSASKQRLSRTKPKLSLTVGMHGLCLRSPLLLRSRPARRRAGGSAGAGRRQVLNQVPRQHLLLHTAIVIGPKRVALGGAPARRRRV